MVDIYPCFYPTTAMFIDDDYHFLNALSTSIEMQSEFRILCYSGVRPFLEDIHMRNRGRSILSNHWNQLNTSAGSLSEHSADYECLDAMRHIHDTHRHDEVSVVIVDYDMPELDGLSLCARIEDSLVKKAVLTGMFNNESIVDAFNNGLVHGYIEKGDRNLVEKILAFLDQQQYAYFAEMKRQYYACGVNLPTFMSDTVFANYFIELCDRLNIKEYYLASSPAAMLMVGGGNDDYYSLLIYTDDQLQTHYDVAREKSAPTALLDGLSGHQVLPNFWKSDGFYDDSYGPNLENYLVEPTDVVEGDSGKYYCGLIHRPERYREVMQKFTLDRQHAQANDSAVNSEAILK